MSPWIHVDDQAASNERKWIPSPLRSQDQHSLLAKVRRRDGDACRVCACVVHNDNPKSPYALSYRVLNPGKTLTMDGVVVVCRRHLVDGFVLSAPGRPFYASKTLAWLDDANQASEAATLAATKNSEDLLAGDLSDGHCRARRDVEPVRPALVVDELDSVRISIRVNCGELFLDRFSQNPGDLVGLSIDIDLSHSSSPSVGAPSGAVCDNSNPTEGDSTRKKAAS